MKWLPNGSDLIADDTKPNAGSKPKTFTSFSCSQDSLPEFSKKPLGPTNPDIILAKLGPGQVILLHSLSPSSYDDHQNIYYAHALNSVSDTMHMFKHHLFWALSYGFTSLVYGDSKSLRGLFEFDMTTLIRVIWFYMFSCRKLEVVLNYFWIS